MGANQGETPGSESLQHGVVWMGWDGMEANDLSLSLSLVQMREGEET